MLPYRASLGGLGRLTCGGGIGHRAARRAVKRLPPTVVMMEWWISRYQVAVGCSLRYQLGTGLIFCSLLSVKAQFIDALGNVELISPPESPSDSPGLVEGPALAPPRGAAGQSARAPVSSHASSCPQDPVSAF
jgi:hypothetical protein